jgi:hypothetical protein
VGGLTSAQTITEVRQLLDNALATPSVKLIPLGTMPKRADTAYTTNQALNDQFRLEVNTYIRSLKGTDPKIVIVDYDLTAWDPTNPLHCTDGLHPEQYGAIIFARAMADVILPYLSPSTILFTAPSDYGNLIPNAGFTGSGGLQTAVSGVIPAGWRIRNFSNGLTAASSQRANGDGTNTEIITLNGTTTAQGNVTMDYPSITYAGNAGDVFDFWGGLKIINGTNLGGILVASDGVFNFGGGTSVTSPITQDIDGIFRPEGLALTGTDTTANPQIGLYFDAGVTVTNMKIEINKPTWRLVPGGQ